MLLEIRLTIYSQYDKNKQKICLIFFLDACQFLSVIHSNIAMNFVSSCTVIKSNFENPSFAENLRASRSVPSHRLSDGYFI